MRSLEMIQLDTFLMVVIIRIDSALYQCYIVPLLLLCCKLPEKRSYEGVASHNLYILQT